MADSSANIRIRPLRLGFLVEPNNRTRLRDVLEINASLWGGLCNFLIPIFKKTPARYNEQYFRAPRAQDLIRGLVEAFQPDLLVETAPGLGRTLPFDTSRVLSLDQFNELDQNGQRRYGIDLRSVCADWYHNTFRFVQRHAPNVMLPTPTDRKFELLFTAIFGRFPASGDLSECQKHFVDLLDAKEKVIDPLLLHTLSGANDLYPLRVGMYELATHRRGWSSGPQLFYMDESQTFDIIEFWNLRAVGWRIKAFPRSLAPKLTEFCQKFILDAHRPYPPPSNASEDATFLCSRSCSFEEMRAFVSTLKWPTSYHISVDQRVPRLWEEWGRSADHAQPQAVEHRTQPTDVFVIGSSIAVSTVLPEFLEHRQAAAEHACTNVMEALPGGAPVIPWQNIDAKFLTGQLHGENTWVGREGICTTAGKYRMNRHLRLPDAFNVFSAWASKSGFEIEISPAGRIANQLINSLGGLHGIRIVGNEELIKVLDRMANGVLEVPIEGDPAETGDTKRRLRKSAIPFFQLQQVLKNALPDIPQIGDNYLSALLKSNVLALGYETKCTECSSSTWYALDELNTKLKCSRCLKEFDFPLTKPHQQIWSYRVQGPFAVEDYAAGSYCVATAIHFLSEQVGTKSCTWIPSFSLTKKTAALANSEADFGVFLKPGPFTNLTEPILVFGECKSFGEFEARDYLRMETLAKLAPGAVLCFCTFRNELTKSEKIQIAKLARRGRKPFKTGQEINPVLILTKNELFGQFKMGRFSDDYPDKFAKMGEGAFMRGDLREICDLTQQMCLGIESFYEWRETSRGKRKPKSSTKAPEGSNASAG